jgi:uncharacterized repeat protein (TIGR03803 family)
MKRENLELPQGTSLRGQNACNCEHFFLIRIASLAFIFWLATAIGSFGQSFATVHSFIGDPSEGSEVYAPVIQATDGSLYGITMSGGSGSCTFGCGTFYKITPAGALTTLYSFTSFQVPGTLIQGANGNFYGTSGIRGAFSAWCDEGCGSFFELTPGARSPRFTVFARKLTALMGVVQTYCFKAPMGISMAPRTMAVRAPTALEAAAQCSN